MSQIHLGRNLLDHQLLDKDGRRCGNADDLAIEQGPQGRAEVVAILVGPGYWHRRGAFLGGLAGRIGGSGRVRVPWSEVEKVTSGVVLRKRADELGLGRIDDRLRPLLQRIPGAGR
jgi:sporulation protein YlmC with PRC-barrel domain